MSNADGQILYIGQSGNLRARLGAYRNANPCHLPKRIVRLVHLVTSITWERCSSARLARVRENQLLRLHRPRFNRMNTWPQAYCFLGLRRSGDSLAFSWTKDSGTDIPLFGAFKSGAIYAYLALLRLFWSATISPSSPYDYPRQLLSGKPPENFSIDMSAGGWTDIDLIEALIFQFLRGESHALASWLTAAIRTDHLSLFHGKLVQADLDIILAFYETGPKRLHRLKREHGLEEHLVPREHLDDLIALSQANMPSRL
jgi:hypothetical protein